MTTRKTTEKNYDLPFSLLVLGEEESKMSANDVLRSVTNGTLSHHSQDVINQWQKVLKNHTRNWSTQQWESISIEQLWSEITSRVRPEEVVYMYRSDYEGNMRRYMLHNGRMLEMDQWMHNDSGFGMWPDMNTHVVPHQVSHSRDTAPLMITALVNVAVDCFSSNPTPFIAVAQNAFKEYKNKFCEDLIFNTAHAAIKDVLPEDMGTVLKTLNASLPFNIVQPLWINAGIDLAQMSWVKKGLSKDTEYALRLTWNAIANASKQHSSLKHIHVMGDVLFSAKSLAYLEESEDAGKKFKQALGRVLTGANGDIERFKKWCATPSDCLAKKIFELITDSPKLLPYIPHFLDICNSDQKLEFIQKTVYRDNSLVLQSIPEEHLRCAFEDSLKDGNLTFANVLMKKSSLQITEKDWGVYWGWMESEYAELGRGLRAMMERKMMTAAVDPADTQQSTSKKRKM